jgi:hypothetical protein
MRNLAGLPGLPGGLDDIVSAGRKQSVKSRIGGYLAACRDGDSDKIGQLKLARARGAQVTSRRAEVGAAQRGHSTDNRHQSGHHAVSADSGLKGIAECLGLVGRQLDDEPTTTLEWHAHHDPAALLRDLKRTITRPRLHRRHPYPLPVIEPRAAARRAAWALG